MRLHIILKGFFVAIQKNQSGFAHLMIITVILGLGLVGTLGFVFYQNFIAVTKTPVVSKDEKTVDKQAENVYKTFTDEKYNYSFKYLDKWTLGPINVVETDPEYQYMNRMMDVKNENGEVMATLTVGVSGLGGTCSGMDEADIPTYTVLDSEKSMVKASKPVAFDFMVKPSDGVDGAYYAGYGLTDTYIRLGDFEHVCLGYNLFNSNLNTGYKGNMIISFSNGVTMGNKRFASLDDAKKYMESDEYKEIKKMILSFNY